MAIFLGSTGPQWPKRVYPSPMFPHYGMRNYFDKVIWMPGFSNDTAAGSAIKITFTSGYYPQRFDYVDKDNTAITDGVWASGFVPSDVSGGDVFQGFYMDEADELLYILVLDTNGGNPHYPQLVNVNKAGVVGTYSASWEQYSGTSFDIGVDSASFGGLVRTADGSGDFKQYMPQSNISTTTANAAEKFRGSIATFNETTGAMTEAHLLPDTALGRYKYYNLHIGPTSNNIMGGVYGRVGKTDQMYGALVNISTGKGQSWVGYPHGFTVNYNSQSENINVWSGRWRGYYYISGTLNYADGVAFFNITDLDNMLDEMAVQHGIL